MRNLCKSDLMDASAAISRECSVTGGLPTLKLRKFSRWSEENSTIWWLCKESHVGPAYRQGKMIIGEPERFGFSSGIFCGLHVERGMKQSLNPDEKLGRDWKWHNFIDDMDSEVPAAVARATAIMEQPLDVILLASTSPKSFDRVQFSSSGANLSLVKAELGESVLTLASKANVWSELKRNLVGLPVATDWHWIDVHIGSQFSLNPGGPDDQKRCVGMLQCFNNWLGSK